MYNLLNQILTSRAYWNRGSLEEILAATKYDLKLIDQGFYRFRNKEEELESIRMLSEFSSANNLVKNGTFTIN